MRAQDSECKKDGTDSGKGFAPLIQDELMVIEEEATVSSLDRSDMSCRLQLGLRSP